MILFKLDNIAIVTLKGILLMALQKQGSKAMVIKSVYGDLKQSKFQRIYAGPRLLHLN